MIARVGVVGAGTMGLGIAQLCAQSGFSVKIHDPLPAALASVPARLRAALDAAVLKGRISTQQGDRVFHAISASPDLGGLAGADLIIEAAPEDLTLKQELFARLSVLVPDAVLATNTSSLSVKDVMARATHPERALGMHFFNPPVAMRLVELVRAPFTAPEVFSGVWEFALQGLRRTPVDVNDVPGFVVNRVMRPYYVHAQRLCGPAAPFALIDEVCRERGGVPMGPFELMDLIGLDTNLAITKSIYAALGKPERFTPPALQQSLVDRGALGRKAGRGFYLYTEGKKSGPNPEAFVSGPGADSGDAAWDSLRSALIAEAEFVVAEKTASPSDVDVAIKLAMNFPKGPFEWRKESTAA
jgi:3-hydroxybutyryl-CoA dehydrogenase